MCAKIFWGHAKGSKGVTVLRRLDDIDKYLVESLVLRSALEEWTISIEDCWISHEQACHAKDTADIRVCRIGINVPLQEWMYLCQIRIASSGHSFNLPDGQCSSFLLGLS